jgi:hypothetical protein
VLEIIGWILIGINRLYVLRVRPVTVRGHPIRDPQFVGRVLTPQEVVVDMVVSTEEVC